jgi:hypothetical protein
MAATGADPFWVAEAIALERDAVRSKAPRPRPQLRLVAAPTPPDASFPIAHREMADEELPPPRVNPRLLVVPAIRELYWCDFPADAQLPG